MEKKRYQVFISSTYLDLAEERKALLDTIWKIDCIPAGMENFAAFDDEQLEYIKRVIDDSDYYVLVIGGRYGSVSQRNVSYTEEEFDYALSKSVPILVFFHSKPEDIPVGKTDMDNEKKNQLKNFIDKAKKNRMGGPWANISELSLSVTQSLIHMMKARPGVGWVRGSAVASSELLREINELRKLNDRLESEAETSRTLERNRLFNEKVTIGFHRPNSSRVRITKTLEQFLVVVGPSCLFWVETSIIAERICKNTMDERDIELDSKSIVTLDLDILTAKFVQSGLMRQSESRVMLSESGNHLLIALLAAIKQ